jgi:Nuclease-related domain
MIPETPVDTDSRAERRLFERLRDETPDEIVAFHSVAWQLPGKKGRPEQGESDFVLAHPDYGVLTLEVKGGTVRYDAKAGKWFTVGRSGESVVKDPGRQARDSSHALGRALARSARGGGTSISFGHAVAFPDCRIERSRSAPTSHASSCSTTAMSHAFPTASTPCFATGSTRARKHRSAARGSGCSSACSQTRSSSEPRLRTSSRRSSASSSRSPSSSAASSTSYLARRALLSLGVQGQRRPSSPPRRHVAWRPRASAFWS